MKRSQMLVAGRAAGTQVDPTWERTIEMIKGLSVDQRLKLAENIRTTAVEDIRAQQEKLQSELSGLSSLLGTPTETPQVAHVQRGNSGPGRPVAANGVRDKILMALRKGPKTIRQIQDATRQKWVATPISQLVQNREIVSDGNRPATFSLAR